MRKSTWMAQLERALSREGMTGAEKRTVLNYYEEMYQDRLDDGAEEEAIIKEFGFPEDVVQSVRENDERTREEEKREERVRKNSVPSDGVPTGTYVPPAYDAEAQGYYRPAPNYGANGAYGAPINTAPPMPKEGKSSGDSVVSVVRTVMNVILAIVLFALGVGLGVGGIATVISSFVIVAFSAGIWLIVFGVGLVLFAFGCLIFGSAIKFTKSIGGQDGGER